MQRPPRYMAPAPLTVNSLLSLINRHTAAAATVARPDDDELDYITEKAVAAHLDAIEKLIAHLRMLTHSARV